MTINDIQACASFYQAHYLHTFYLVTTYNGNSFILIGEKANFPHLMGIQQNTYRSNGYNNPKILFNDILGKKPINCHIIPNLIPLNSKMYKKALNFRKSTDIFWKNYGPLTVNFNPSLSGTKLNNVDVLLTDINTGYMLGWVSNSRIPINADIGLERYCICTWIDESSGTTRGKEKYMPNQDIELIRYVLAFDKHSRLLRRKEYKYSRSEKLQVLKICQRNNCNLLLDNHNEPYYQKLSAANKIHCKINGKQY